MRLQSTGWQALLSSALLLTTAWAKKEKPAVKSKKFDFIPLNVNYFEDSDVLLFEDGIGHNVYRSEDAGVNWDVVKGGPEGKVMELVMHTYDKQRAYIITNDKTHWQTSDRGKTWVEFKADSLASIFRNVLEFHAGDPNRIIFNSMDCSGIFCEELTMYTTDGFSKAAKYLRSDTAGCHWAKGSTLFTTAQKDLDKDRILCVVKGRFSPWRKDYRLLISDNFFGESGGVVQEFEPELEAGRTVQGIVNMAFVKPYVVVAATAESTDEMALYASDDTVKWHRAIFPHDHKITEEAYTLLEGTNYSIQIDVMNTRPSNPMGVLFSSNSNGTYFSRNMEHTNRNSYGLVDFEKMAGVQGIVYVNVVENWEEVEKSNTAKKIKSKISFDDGRTWEALTVDKEELHLHSVTDLSNSGRVFSSPAPGLVMGIGNTGKHLEDYLKGNLYVSDDAGLTWRLGLKGPHKYEFGDQGSVLLAVEEGINNEAKYSLDHGKTWQEVDLPQKIRPVQLTTTPDSTSLKFLLEAVDDAATKSGYIIAIDFADLHERTCKDDDMEIWHARVDDKGKPTCLMGHKQSYRRRKPDADCFLMKEFEDPQVITEPCDCTDIDFECDYNFLADGKECKKAPGATLVLPEGACKAFGPEDTFQGSSGWRLIPGNDCQRVSGAQKDDPVPRKCSLAAGEPSSGKPDNSVALPVNGKDFKAKVYLERTGISAGEDETIIMQTENGVFISQNHGKSWEHILKDEKIERIYPHPYFNDMVFFLTRKETVWYSTERGKNLRSFKAPYPPNFKHGQILNFHPKFKDWLIWIGDKDCDSAEGCHAVASVTKDRGDDKWQVIQRYVRKCEFITETETGYKTPGQKETPETKKHRDKLIYCEVRSKERNDPDQNPYKLVYSDDFFEETKEAFPEIVDFATMSEFIVVATRVKEHDTLKIDASVDGHTFADAKFPYGFNVDHQVAYTVLDSSTHSVFLHVTVFPETGLEYGTIIKSNSNGTSYVHSLDAVNRDTDGYVDFEKMTGIEGVALANTVANWDSKNYAKEKKKIKTVITHNDGAEWDYLTPPAKDSEGKNFACSGSTDKCSLHIHGYTERLDKSHTYSSTSAVGLMIGTGNVGEFLTSQKDASTFMSADAGLTWKHVKPGTFMWEYGDQGGILVIVKEREPTKQVWYSLDEGDHWDSYDFSEKDIEIHDLTTVPSDNSRNFLLWGKDGNDLVTINLDFSGLTDKPCKLDENNVEAGDYYLWRPRHPKQDDDCLFGHVSQYHRKKTTSTCYNGRMIPHLHDIAKNCSCTRRDYECDYNYQRQKDGSCALVQGFSPPDHSLVCATDENIIEYEEPTGYRRIPLTTCQDGREFDKSVSHACPGKGDQFNKKHGLSFLGLFFAIVFPFVLAGGVGYWIWKNWTTKFGQIRLGEQSTFDDEAPWIKYPVIVIAGVAAVAQAIPLLVASLWRSASSAMGRGRMTRFTTRDSFARGRGDYAVVDEDEGELLGEESDEEV